ncbi:hypothetical protein [Shouchella patagoniensis]|uniref:hypothetical protein n=1 Tax=Shouchella patagoniensis TaxID=228576 RepID=UPI000994F719|nr:hypothetical protein [Shouchella patagoniensis]
MNLNYSIYRSNEWKEVNEFIKVLNKKLSRPCDEWTVLIKNSNKLIAIFQFWTYSFYKKWFTLTS